MTRGRVAILSARTGWGHQSVDEALAEAWEPSEVVILYPEQLFAMPLLRHLPWVYDHVMAKCTWLYDLAYRMTDSEPATRIISKLARTLLARRAASALSSTDPSLIVVTHPLFLGAVAVAATSRLISRPPVVVVVNDPVSPHASWVQGGVDLTCLPSHQAVAHLATRGLRGPLQVTGLPVRSAFLQLPETRRRRTTKEPILVLGRSSASLEHRVRLQLAALDLDISLRRLDGTSELRPRDGLEMAMAMSSSSAVVSKAGPSTILEAATLGVPLLLTAECGGQEAGNVDWAVRNGLALDARSEPLLRAALRSVFREGWVPNGLDGITPAPQNAALGVVSSAEALADRRVRCP